MGDSRLHAAELDELGRIDYFLDQLARAVERGEVPLASYQTLAPRFLARREELVAILTRVRRAPAPVPGAVMSSGSTVRSSAPQFPPQPTLRSTSVREPISWTTVVLFLGAFLVIVASGIFAFAVWNSTGPAFKLAFLGTLTAAFYAAGHYARTKLELRTGSAALTVVGSAMLLFDCWIVIDGWNFTGPLPWAAALLLCSAVYWLTEVKLGDRFYGIAGVAAQVGWWWLMSAGLHLEVPIRLAGISLIALAWQIVAEKARDDSEFASLAQVLLWGAPLVGVAASVGVALDAVTVGTSSLLSAACAALVAVSTAAIVVRTTLIAPAARRGVAGAVQLPLFVMLLQPGPSTWVGVVGMFTVTAIYALLALRRFGIPFAVAAAGMELLAVNAVLSLLKVSDPVRIASMAALAVTWTLASLLAEKLVEVTAPAAAPGAAPAAAAAPVAAEDVASYAGARETSDVLNVGGFGLLVLASALTQTVGVGVPLSGIIVPPSDVVLAAWILVAWAATCLIRREPVPAFATALWSLFTMASILAWAFPSWNSAYYALGLLGVATCWLAVRTSVAHYYGVSRDAWGWTMRAISLVILIVGALMESLAPDQSLEATALLALGVSAVFALDAVFAGPPVSASIAAVTAVSAAGLGGQSARELANDASLAAAGAGAILAGLSVALRDRWALASWFAIGAAGAATLVVGAGASGWPLAGSLALVTLAWAGATATSSEQYLALPAGVALFGAAVVGVSVVDPASSAALVGLATVACMLGVPAAFKATGRGGAYGRIGQSLALAGLIGLAYLIVQVSSNGALDWVMNDSPRWTGFNEHTLAAIFLIAGAYVVAQSMFWKVEVALYAGWALFLIAVCVELGAWDFTTVQFYTSAIALYLAAMGAMYATRVPGRRVPKASDIATVAVGVGFPALVALGSPMGSLGFKDLVWAVLLALVGITAGIALKVRAYLFGSAGALVLVVGWRSFAYLASVWWLVLGIVGTAMLVIALTWERQRQVLSATQRRLQDGFEHWR